jgi:hypothetical protein
MKPYDLLPRHPENYPSGQNDTAKQTTCIVQVIWPTEFKDILYFAKGFPLITRNSCQGGMNVKIEFFVPDIEENSNLLTEKDILT